MNPHTKSLAKLMRDTAHRHHLHDIFRDFVEMGAIAVANRFDMRQHDEREARYHAILKRYDERERGQFPKMFAELVEALELGPADVLGEVFGELEQGNSARGQFFTPYEVCRLMAGITLADGSDARACIAERGFVTTMEPAVGAGAMVIALAEKMAELGIPYQERLHVTAVDVDPRAAHMAFLQFSLLGIPAVVVVGNTLTLEEREHWYTPMHWLGFWANKLHRGYALGSAMDLAADAAIAEGKAPAPVEPLKPVNLGEQLALFGEAA